MSLIRFQNDLDFPRNFSTMLDKFFDDAVKRGTEHFNPSTDISETENAFEVKVAVPGLKKEDFDIQMEGQTLSISGEKKFKKEEDEKEGRKYHRIETQYGYFNRTFTLPDEADLEHIEASYTDGVLEISIPKDVKKLASKKIEVK